MRQLEHLAEDLQALMHPYVLGELALGSLPRRDFLLERFATMPQPPVARLDLMMQLIEASELTSTGIGLSMRTSWHRPSFSPVVASGPATNAC